MPRYVGVSPVTTGLSVITGVSVTGGETGVDGVGTSVTGVVGVSVTGVVGVSVTGSVGVSVTGSVGV